MGLAAEQQCEVDGGELTYPTIHFHAPSLSAGTFSAALLSIVILSIPRLGPRTLFVVRS